MAKEEKKRRRGVAALAEAAARNAAMYPSFGDEDPFAGLDEIQAEQAVTAPPEQGESSLVANTNATNNQTNDSNQLVKQNSSTCVKQKSLTNVTIKPNGQTNKTKSETKQSNQMVGSKVRPVGGIKRLHSNKGEEDDNGPVMMLPPQVVIKTRNQRIVASHLRRNPDIITTYQALSDELGIKKFTIRNMILVFEKQGLVTKTNPSYHYVRLRFNHPDWYDKMVTSIGSMTPRNDHVLLEPETDRNLSVQLENALGGQSGQEEETGKTIEPKIEQKPATRTDGAKGKLLALSQAQMALLWPKLAGIDFGPDQIGQIVALLEAQGKSLDRIMKSLDYIDHELEAGTAKDKEGKAVGTGYIFNALARNGYWRRPQGYKSAEELAIEDEIAEAEAITKARKKAEEAKFQAWLDNLPDEEKTAILAANRIPGPERTKLFKAYKERS